VQFFVFLINLNIYIKMLKSNLTFDPYSEVTVLCLCIVCKTKGSHAKAKYINFHLITHLVADHFMKSVYDNNYNISIESSNHSTVNKGAGLI